MKIQHITVDRFGVWRDLRIENISSGITAFYGRNEAGKTTLMRFLRSMLYGADPQRARFLFQDGTSAAGGRLQIESETGQYHVARQFRPARGRAVEDSLNVCDTDGSSQGAHALDMLLSGVDEPVYRNVYAFGLREVQELGTLSDTDAAKHLYDLSAGLDRVSLVDVLRTLRTARGDLLDPATREGRLTDLIAQRDRLQGELDELQTAMSRFRGLINQRNRMAGQIDKLQAQRGELDRQARVTELAFSLHDKWTQLRQTQQKLKALGRVPAVSSDDAEQVNQLGQQIVEASRLRKQLKAQHRQVRQQQSTLPINASLVELGPRIDALAEQREWIGSLQQQIDRLAEDVAEQESQLAARRRKLELPAEGEWSTADGIARAIAQLRQPARRLRDARRTLQQAQASPSPAETEAAPDQQTAHALAARGAASLAEALEQAGSRTAALRRRIQLEEKLERLEGQRSELQEGSDESFERQMLSPWVLLATGGTFALGVMLLLAGLFMPASVVGSFGWMLALLGIAGSGAAVATKVVMQRAGDREAEANRRQQEIVGDQIAEANRQREAMDAERPRGGGPLAVQLRQAERELSELEDLLPLESQQPARQDTASAAEARIAELQQAFQQARRDWHRALHAAGLPAKLSPRQVRALANEGEELAETERRLVIRRHDLEQQRESLGAVGRRVGDMLLEAGLPTSQSSLVDRVDTLVRAWQDHQQWTQQRDELRAQSHRFRSQQLKSARELSRLHAARRAMLDRVGAENPEAFFELQKKYVTWRGLMQQRRQFEAAISTARSGVCEDADLAAEIDGSTEEQIERRWDRLAAKLQKADDRLKELFERRGQLAEKLRQLAGDRRAAEKQLELHCVQQQLRQAVSRWQELAVTSLLLDSIRRRFENERQPATLREASRYLKQLTGGQYVRVWTPMDEDTLMVDAADGRPLSVEMLSRGTREQLFLSLRLALVALYAQRGIRLPLVLDDVLVNFDAERTAAAATVLRDFAAQGYQILVFTCHRHIVRALAAVGVDNRELPDHRESAVAPAVVETSATPAAPPPVVADVPETDRSSEVSGPESVEPEEYELAEEDFEDPGNDEDPPSGPPQLHVPRYERDEFAVGDAPTESLEDEFLWEVDQDEIVDADGEQLDEYRDDLDDELAEDDEDFAEYGEEDFIGNDEGEALAPDDELEIDDAVERDDEIELDADNDEEGLTAEMDDTDGDDDRQSEDLDAA